MPEAAALEAAKPADGSDCTTLEAAQAEIGRLRGLAAGYSTDQVAIIIWGAKGLKDSDFIGKSDPYCAVRVGPLGTSWEQKRRGRKSVVVPGSLAPTWNLGFCVSVAGYAAEPELMIGIFDKDWISSDDALGRATVKFADLSADPVEVALEGGKGIVTVSKGPPTLLAEAGIKPPQIYESIKPVGKLQSAPVSAFADPATNPMFIGKDPLPPQCRGIFWLTKQGGASALASFGGPTNDGGDCSAGVIGADGKYVMRVSGDRSWAMATRYKTATVAQTDLIYTFQFDSPTDPKRCHIYPEFRNLGVALGADAEWALDFDMNLTDGVDDFKGSVVWSRPSWIYGKEMGTYALVQVIDERGAVIEPAWSQFVAYQSSPDAGDTPGTLHYRQID